MDNILSTLSAANIPESLKPAGINPVSIVANGNQYTTINPTLIANDSGVIAVDKNNHIAWNALNICNTGIEVYVIRQPTGKIELFLDPPTQDNITGAWTGNKCNIQVNPQDITTDIENDDALKKATVVLMFLDN